jgi:hypothetical protein
MATSIVQTLPKRVAGRVEHVSWVVDLEAASAIAAWRGAKPGRLEKEAVEMAHHFPRWLLTVVQGQQLLTCPSCAGMLVFDRGLRCAGCGKELGRSRIPQHSRLAWFGLTPPIGVDSLTQLRERLVQRAPARHVVGHSPATGTYLLAPLLASYSEAFPAEPPRVAYLPEFFSIHGMPARGPAHSHHMLGDDAMCLFAAGQWRPEMTCREVLQQRAYAHVVKLLNYANGKKTSFAVVTR